MARRAVLQRGSELFFFQEPSDARPKRALLCLLIQ
jgi:hypothetical protein